jgi:hypothetical protein
VVEEGEGRGAGTDEGTAFRYMLKVAGVQQGAETTFVDMSYGGRGEEVVDGEEEEVMREREDDEILSRVRKSIKPNTKVCSTLLSL